MLPCSPKKARGDPDGQDVNQYPSRRLHSAAAAPASIGFWQQSPNDNRLIPYFNHFGANALVVSAGQLADQAAQKAMLTAVDKWLFWYLSHMQDDGTVHDYRITDGVPEDTGNCDSTDSYAALFLVVLWNRLYVGASLKRSPPGCRLSTRLSGQWNLQKTLQTA